MERKNYEAVLMQNMRETANTTQAKIYLSRVKLEDGIKVRDHVWVTITNKLEAIRPHGMGKRARAKRISFTAIEYEYQAYDKDGYKSHIQIGLKSIKDVKVLGYWSKAKVKAKKKIKVRYKPLPWDKLKIRKYNVHTNTNTR